MFRNISLTFLTAFVICSCSFFIEDTDFVVDSSVKTRIDSTLKSFVDAEKIAGVSALVFEKNKEVYFNAFGYADREAKIPMSRNTIVQIYSMTKPVTGVALMTLYEEGAFKLDDPVSKYIPEFENIKVSTKIDESGNLTLETPKRPMTIRDLTRHTSGLANSGDIPGVGPLFENADPRNQNNTLAQMTEIFSKLPLWFQPGEQWAYGPSVDVQAYLVEKLSGTAFDDYIQENVLGPLKMDETRYVVPEIDRNRMAAVYQQDEETGELLRMPNEEAHSFNLQDWPMKPGGWGLTSTIDDYMKFARMLVNEGKLDGARILDPETVKLMATNHLSDSIKLRSWLPSKGQVGFGIDFAVRLRPPANAEENNGVVGEFFWDGMQSTLFWVDPVNKLTAVLFVQLRPFDQIGLHKSFRDAVYGPYKPKRTNEN